MRGLLCVVLTPLAVETISVHCDVESQHAGQNSMKYYGAVLWNYIAGLYDHSCSLNTYSLHFILSHISEQVNIFTIFFMRHFHVCISRRQV